MKHTCHARNCTTPCRPEYLMCGRCWATVPPNLQRRVYATYRPGQCDDKNPSEEWHVAADAAIAAVALAEGCPPGKLSVNQVRAILALAPELFGDHEIRMRRRLQTIDRKTANVGHLSAVGGTRAGTTKRPKPSKEKKTCASESKTSRS